jgi:hypothetical protein
MEEKFWDNFSKLQKWLYVIFGFIFIILIIFTVANDKSDIKNYETNHKIVKGKIFTNTNLSDCEHFIVIDKEANNLPIDTPNEFYVEPYKFDTIFSNTDNEFLLKKYVKTNKENIEFYLEDWILGDDGWKPYYPKMEKDSSIASDDYLIPILFSFFPLLSMLTILVIFVKWVFWKNKNNFDF